MFLLHLMVARPEFSPIVRFFLAVPLAPLLIEVRRALKDRGDALPINAYGLLTYYAGFSFGAFLTTRFSDMRGTVRFTEESYLLGSLAIALGSIALFAGMRVGERVGSGRTLIARFVPPQPSLDVYRKVVLGYTALSAAVNFLPKPPSLALFITLVMSPYLALGFIAGFPDAFRGFIARNLALGAALFGVAEVAMRGSLAPMIQLTVVALIIQWRQFHKASPRLLAVLVAVFFILQPVKAQYRREAWFGRTQLSPVEKVEAWGRAINNFWIDAREVDVDRVTQSSDRVTETDAVYHAFLLLPGVVTYDEGQDWFKIPIRWIPRFVWPDKPETASFEGRYAIVFHRQSRLGARTTAITLPLVVDGYWNFGWPGIALACGLIGLWVGYVRNAFRGSWALLAYGVVQLGTINCSTALQLTISGLPQSIAGCIVASWGIYAACRFLTRGRPVNASASRLPVGFVRRT